MEAFVLREYDEWLADHLEELVGRYPSKVVAVHARQVVYTGDSEAEVYQWVGKTGLQTDATGLPHPTGSGSGFGLVRRWKVDAHTRLSLQVCPGSAGAGHHRGTQAARDLVSDCDIR